MTEITRPETVPDSAVYDPNAGVEWAWIDVEKDSEGRSHGICKEWTLTGHHHGTCEYEHGVLVENFNFHPDGSLYSHLEKPGNLTLHRAKCESKEPWPTVGEAVEKIVYYSHDKKVNYTTRYFDKDDIQIQPTGDPLPTRPKSVDADARYFVQHGWWVLGSVQQGTNLLVGPWTRWLTDGTLYEEELRTEDGKRVEITTYVNGHIKKYERYFPGEKIQISRNRYDNLSFEEVTDIEGRCIQKSSWSSKDHSFNAEKSFFYDGETLVRVREREAPGYVSYTAKMQTDGKMFCEFFSLEGTRTMSGYIKDELLVGVWNLHSESSSFDASTMEVAADPESSDFVYAVEHAFFESSLNALTDALDEAFLKKLNDIDWKNADSCYGDSESVRDAVVGLTSASASIRSAAMGTIQGETLHQGSLYEVTALVSPFFIELLDHQNTDKASLLKNLRWYAEAGNPWADRAREAKEELQPEEEDWTIGVLGTLDAISMGWEKIAAFSDDPTLVDEVISLAKYGPEAAKGFLHEHAKSEDPVKRAIAVDAISGFSDFKETELSSFLEDDSPLVRLVAALRTSVHHEDKTPKPFVDELIRSLDNYLDIEESYYSVLSSDSDLLAEIAYALGCVRSIETQDRLGWLCDNIEEVGAVSATFYGQALLMLALGRLGDDFATDFIRVMKTLAKSKQFNVFNVNAREVLGMWLLPDAQELFDLAEEMEKEENPEAAMKSWLEAKMN